MAKIAVIGVHGVADQKPGETARSVARAMQAESAVTGSSYDGFCEELLSLPVKKMHLASPPCGRELPPRLKELRGFDERSPYLRWLHNHQGPPAEVARQLETDANLEFMYDQIYFYDPRHSQQPDRENSTYDTVRLRGQRAHRQTGHDVRTDDVDVYEFYWADLSRLQSDVLHILSAFYQLLFHICSLGRDTLDLAEPECRAAGWVRWTQWNVMRTCHRIATSCLSLVIPVLNLCLLGILFIVLPAKVPPNAEIATAIAAAAAIVAVGGLIARLFRAAQPDQPPGMYGAMLAASIPLGCCMVYSPELTGAMSGRNEWSEIAWKKVLTVEWGLLSSAAIGAVLLAFSRRKPQVLIIGPMLWLPSAATVAWLVYRAEPTEVGLAHAAIASAVVALLGLAVAWTVLALAVLIGGCITFRSWSSCGVGGRIDRALATGFISMIGPVTLFAFVTLAIYSPLLSLAEIRYLKLPEAPLHLTLFGGHLPGLYDWVQQRPATLQQAVHWMFQISVTPLADAILLVWGAAAFLVMREFFWPVWAETVRPTSRPADRSQFIGKTLSRAYGSLGVPFGLMFVAVPFIFLAGAAMNWAGWWHGAMPEAPRGIFPLLGAVMFGLIATGKLGVVLNSIWPSLDVILDVDNYLQGRPWNRNPKARIATRYVALLRFLAQQNYDQVVIVAHSQGTVITADLLRFLRANGDPNLASLGFERTLTPDEPHPFPISLLTMGCPLRQLYGWRFPHLYRWARHEGPLDGAAAGREMIGDQCAPNPRELGVAAWINAYNSGDYVGRHIWRDDNLANPAYNAESLFTPWNRLLEAESCDERHVRRELCYGAGAHTHYFEDNATDLARLLDELLNVSRTEPNRQTPQMLSGPHLPLRSHSVQKTSATTHHNME